MDLTTFIIVVLLFMVATGDSKKPKHKQRYDRHDWRNHL